MTYPSLEEISLLNANLCRALADPKRVLILYALDLQPRHVTALAAALDIPQPTISRHLRILREHSLVDSKRDGPSVVYHVADSRIIDLLEMMRQVMFDAIGHQSTLVGHKLAY